MTLESKGRIHYELCFLSIWEVVLADKLIQQN